MEGTFLARQKDKLIDQGLDGATLRRRELTAVISIRVLATLFQVVPKVLFQVERTLRRSDG